MTRLNPFFHRGPIRNPAYFHGRRSAVAQALAWLRQGQSVAIVGPRRIGKTSLLNHLAVPGVLTAHGLVPAQLGWVTLDAESWGNLDAPTVVRTLLEEIRDQLPADGQPLPAATRRAEPGDDADPPGPARALERLAEQVRRAGRQLVIAIDEFEALSANPALDAAFFAGLRGLAMRHGVAFVTASSQPLLALLGVRPDRPAVPFFNFFAQLRLPLFDRAEAETMLAAYAERAGWPCPPATVDRLLALAGPHPLLLQIAGYYAIERLASGATMDDADWSWVRRQFLAEADAHWTYAWQTLPADDQRALALLPLTSLTDPAAIERLEAAGVVAREGPAASPLSPAFAAFVGRQAVPGLLQAPPLTLDPAQHLVLRRGRPLAITPTEFTLLATLVARAGQVVPHAELEATLWAGAYVEDPERLKTVIKTLRRALGPDAACLQNVRGTGYRFVPAS